MTEIDDLMLLLQRHVGSCREWVEEKNNRCAAPSEYVLWGKLISFQGLGPRCYDHARQHVGRYGVETRSDYAVINLQDLARDIVNLLGGSK